MINKDRNLLVVFSLVMIVFLAACTQQRQPCIQTTYISAKTNMYQIVTDSAGVSSIVNYTFPKGLRGIIDTAGNSIVMDSVSSSSYNFHLSSLADSCQWFISADGLATPRDTITFYYDKELHFISNACGYTYYYTLKNVVATHNDIDSVFINNPSVTNDVNVEHVKIFYLKRATTATQTAYPSQVRGPNTTIHF